MSICNLLEVSEAKAWLDRSPKQRRQIRNFDKKIGSIKIDSTIRKILENKSNYREQSDIRDKLEERIREIRPWGEFAFPDPSEFANQRFWFYVVPNGELGTVQNSLQECKLCWELIHQNQTDHYLIIISEQEPDENLMPVKRSHLGGVPLSHLEDMLDKTEVTIEDLLAERESLTRWNYLLNQVLKARLDHADLQQASNGAIDEDSFFLIQGWVPESEQSKIEDFTKQYGAAVIFEKPNKNDIPPTLLDKNSRTGGGSDALGFFQTPNYNTWDLGNLVFYSFSLFFAMIMSDAMYSLIFGLIVFLFRSKLNQTQEARRLKNLAYFMSGSGILWGIFIGSYFGVTPDSDDLLGRIVFIDMNNYDTMMKISVVIGVAHLVIANLMQAFVNRYSSYALAPLGWAAVMAGGLLLWLGMTDSLPSTFEATIGPAVMIVGILLVFFFSSQIKITSFKSLILRILDGLKSVYNITGAFGDVLSYMRLFALGLSGASLAMTFNTLATNALHSSPVTGVLFAGLILLLGHCLNFLLCIMSGVVHGMRLNVIEFVNWGLSDDGYPFKVFSQRTTFSKEED